MQLFDKPRNLMKLDGLISIYISYVIEISSKKKERLRNPDLWVWNSECSVCELGILIKSFEYLSVSIQHNTFFFNIYKLEYVRFKWKQVLRDPDSEKKSLRFFFVKAFINLMLLM